jgi:hypothetical protein
MDSSPRKAELLCGEDAIVDYFLTILFYQIDLWDEAKPICRSP